MAAYGTGRWLTKQEYSLLRKQAKKMGATEINLSAILHTAYFGKACVSFGFKPLQFQVDLFSTNIFEGLFKDREGAEAIKRDMDLALNFIDFLKEFETFTE